MTSCRFASAGASTLNAGAPGAGAGAGAKAGTSSGNDGAFGAACGAGVGREGIEPGFGMGTGVSFADGRVGADVPAKGGGLMAFWAGSRPWTSAYRFYSRLGRKGISGMDHTREHRT